MFDMQGRPIDTGAGPIEYLGAFARWFDARYADAIGADDEAAAREFAANIKASRDAYQAVERPVSVKGFEDAFWIKGTSLGETVANFGRALMDNPPGGVGWTLSTLGESAPQLAAALGATMITRNPAVRAAVGGAGSYATERYTSPAEFLEEKGIDLGRPEDVERLISDPSLLEEAANRGAIRGIVIAAFETLSFGLAGRAKRI